MEKIKLLSIIILASFFGINAMEISDLLNNTYESKSADVDQPNKKMKLTFICDEKVEKRSDDKKIECRYCGRYFEKSYLPKHIRSHTKEKPFKCVICGKSYSQISHLNFHKKAHIGAGLFVCDYKGASGESDKYFSTEFDLTKHKKDHSIEKPLIFHILKNLFICDFEDRNRKCNKVFEQKKDLTAHKKIVHKI